MTFDFPLAGTALQTYILVGEQLFQGAVGVPQMLRGQFSLGSNGSGHYELSASLFSPAPIPEPATWTLMISGLAHVLARRRSRPAPTTA